MPDSEKLNAVIGKLLADLGGAFNVPLVRIGDKLGLYQAMHNAGPLTVDHFCAKAGIAPRYAREWLANQAASGYIVYDPQQQTFELPPEQAMIFADEASPVYMMGAFDLAAAMTESQPKVEEAFKTGSGVGWGNFAGCLFCATGRFFRPGYQNHLVSEWLPALDGVVDRLNRGAVVADVGCGHGFSTVFMAKAFPNSRFVGFDFHEPSVEQARLHAEQHGVSGNTSFEVGLASDYAGKDYDLVTFFDCLHDMGDPTGAARHVRETLKPDGTWMIIEPMAGDRLEDNLNPVGRLYYAGSTMICVPTALHQAGGKALGAQAGFQKLSEVIRSGGFGSIRKASETPFNMILQATA
ncbi:MAG: class I SAM-dependent methyltransferase [Acetobacteraceae bacterium]